MAVTFDAAGPGATAASSATSPLTWSHVDAAQVTAFLNFATTFSGSASDITADSYGGNAATLLAFQLSGGVGHVGGGISLYSLASPPTGSNTVSVSFTGGNDTIGASVSATGSSGLGTPATSFATGASSVSVTVSGTTTGGLIVVCACYGGGAGGGAFSGTNGVTIKSAKTGSVGSAADNAVIGIVASTGGGANQVVGFSNTGGTDNWGIIAVELLPAPGAAPFAPPQRAPRGAPGARRGRALAGLSSPGAPVVQVRQLLLALAAAAGADDFGVAFQQGLTVFSGPGSWANLNNAVLSFNAAPGQPQQATSQALGAGGYALSSGEATVGDTPAQMIWQSAAASGTGLSFQASNAETVQLCSSSSALIPVPAVSGFPIPGSASLATVITAVNSLYSALQQAGIIA